MGDRALVVFTDDQGSISPAIYSHWGGYEIPESLKAAGNRGILRRDDPHYAAARFCGFLHEQDPSATTGLGVNVPPTDLNDDNLRSYSHGDAGVVIVNTTTGAVRYAGGGYLERRSTEPDDENGEVQTLPTTITMSD